LFIYRAKFSLTVKDEVIIQPFSSKVSRMAISSISNDYKNYMDSRESFKPYTVTALKLGERPLYSDGRKLMKLLPRNVYNFTVSSLRHEFMNEITSKPYTNFKLYNTEGYASIESIEVVEEGSLTIEDSKFYKVEFLTPTLLQLPRPSLRRKRNRYVLFPYVPLFFLSIANHYNKYFSPPIIGMGSSRAVYYLMETDYYLTPKTVKYDEREVRGFTGWVMFNLTARKESNLRNRIRKLLAYSQFMGVGKSRAIGFGEVKVVPIKE